MRMSRREALTAGGLGILGVAGLAVPLGAGLQAKSISRLATRNMPVPFATTFVRPPALPFTAMEDDERPVPSLHRDGAAVHGSHRPRARHTGVRLQRQGPRPDHPGEPGHAGQAAGAQPAAGAPPHLRARVQHLDPPPRVGVAPPVRRVCRRRHAPGRLQGLLVPELAAGTHPLVPRPQRAHDRAERVLRPGCPVPPHGQGGARPAPAGCVRRAAHDLGRDVRRRRLARVRRQQPLRAVGRRHPRQRTTLAGDAGQAEDLPLPRPERVDRSVAAAASEQRRTDGHGGDGRRADAEGTAGDRVQACGSGALRVPHRLLAVHAGHRVRAAGTSATTTTSTTTTPTR